METGYLINGVSLKVEDFILFKKMHYTASCKGRVTHIFLDNTVKVTTGGGNSIIVTVSEIEEIVKQDKPELQNKIPDTIVERILDKKATAASTKPQLQLTPPAFSEELARVFEFGKEKYGERNWITGDGVTLQTYLGAILRHTNKIISGEDIDPESGLEHVAHIAASCAIILDAKKCGKLKDDRILPNQH
jgi:hypothetical protein